MGGLGYRLGLDCIKCLGFLISLLGGDAEIMTYFKDTWASVHLLITTDIHNEEAADIREREVYTISIATCYERGFNALHSPILKHRLMHCIVL